MKTKVVLLILIIASQLVAGQTRYESMLRAQALSDRGESDEALAALSTVITNSPDAGLLLLRGNILLEMRNVTMARSDFMAAEKLNPGAGLYGLAKCAAASGDAIAAIAYLEAHLKTSQRKSEPEIMLDDAFSTITSTSEWRNLWKKDWYKGYERKEWEIELYLRSGRIDLAEETLGELSALYAGMPVTDFCEARILSARGRYREASALLSQLTISPDSPPEYLLALAEARAGEGDYFSSATIYGRLISAEYPDAVLFLRRAEMLLKAGDRTPAKSDIKKYLEFNPESSEALGLLGKTYAEEGAIFEALPYLNTNIDRHPGNAMAFCLRGDAWMAARSWTKAAEDYTMSLDLDPNSATVNLNMGIALINCGKEDDACYYLRKARALGEKNATQYLSRHCIR
ncbi:MAG: tetratricopeptide repeat protein [Bacteroidales bacterium]|nr:tetratricopeptide repeat protein [Bacteroidales bacterium]